MPLSGHLVGDRSERGTDFPKSVGRRIGRERELLREGCRETKGVTRRIEQDEKGFGCKLRFRSDGAEGDRSLLGLLQIIDVEVDVRLFRYWPLGPRRPPIVLDAHGDEQQPVINRDDSVVLRGDGDFSAEQRRPECAEWARIITVQRNSQAYLRHVYTMCSADLGPR
jgi:hypothetical protein